MWLQYDRSYFYELVLMIDPYCIIVANIVYSKLKRHILPLLFTYRQRPCQLHRLEQESTATH